MRGKKARIIRKILKPPGRGREYFQVGSHVGKKTKKRLPYIVCAEESRRGYRRLKKTMKGKQFQKGWKVHGEG